MIRGFYALFLFLVVRAASGAYPPPLDLGPVDSYGTGIQRTMSEIAGTPDPTKTIRILFYGQSITVQPWWRDVTNSIISRFPNARLEIANRAIPGFTTELLVNTAENDLYSFYPDLVFFQAYGSTNDYERIIANVRCRTTAEILLATDHLMQGELVDETSDRATAQPGTESWRTYVFLPDLAQRYGAELADVRSSWKAYLNDYHLDPTNLLVDGVHLNDQGNYLMGELIKPHFRQHAPVDFTYGDAIQTIYPGQNLWTNGALEFEFVGNRIDLIGDPVEKAGFTITIDGKAPDQWPELYSFGRLPVYPYTSFSFLSTITSEKPLIAENWKMTILEYTNKPVFVRFRVDGSKTGFDGEGTSSTPFVSNSGRLVIPTQSWYPFYTTTQVPVPPGSEFTWPVVASFTNQILPSGRGYTNRVTTVALGLGNGRHRMKVTGGPTGFRGFRVYNPLAMEHPQMERDYQIQQITNGGASLTLQIAAGGRYIIETSTNLVNATWTATSAPLTKTSVQIPNLGREQFYRVRGLD